jgi:hypothetical protein
MIVLSSTNTGAQAGSSILAEINLCVQGVCFVRLKNMTLKLVDCSPTEKEVDDKIKTHQNTCPYPEEIEKISKKVYENESNKEIVIIYKEIKNKVIIAIVGFILTLAFTVLFIKKNMESNIENALKNMTTYNQKAIDNINKTNNISTY